MPQPLRDWHGIVILSLHSPQREPHTIARRWYQVLLRSDVCKCQHCTPRAPCVLQGSTSRPPPAPCALHPPPRAPLHFPPAPGRAWQHPAAQSTTVTRWPWPSGGCASLPLPRPRHHLGSTAASAHPHAHPIPLCGDRTWMSSDNTCTPLQASSGFHNAGNNATRCHHRTRNDVRYVKVLHG